PSAQTRAVICRDHSEGPPVPASKASADMRPLAPWLRCSGGSPPGSMPTMGPRRLLPGLALAVLLAGCALLAPATPEPSAGDILARAADAAGQLRSFHFRLE